MRLSKFRILYISLLCTVPVLLVKFGLHYYDWEIITLGSLHTSVVTGTFFVVGFLLSATIADYKESEKIPAEFAATIENMHDDIRSIHASYPKFDLTGMEKRLQAVSASFSNDVRHKKHVARLKVHELHLSFADMEKAGVPANFIVKLKQQQMLLTRHLFRVTYIQRITFIPSATILVRMIIPLTLAMLVLTEIEPFFGGMALVAIISLIMIYLLILIPTISTPFQAEGKTQDDVSLFLIDETSSHLESVSTSTSR